ncbi:MAG: hypothetical protein VYB74_07195, partial [Cyanobacteriota bacterium]|nr:hypothetical protein [Cyanobacteriota bacterium]
KKQHEQDLAVQLKAQRTELLATKDKEIGILDAELKSIKKAAVAVDERAHEMLEVKVERFKEQHVQFSEDLERRLLIEQAHSKSEIDSVIENVEIEHAHAVQASERRAKEYELSVKSSEDETEARIVQREAALDRKAIGWYEETQSNVDRHLAAEREKLGREVTQGISNARNEEIATVEAKARKWVEAETSKVAQLEKQQKSWMEERDGALASQFSALQAHAAQRAEDQLSNAASEAASLKQQLEEVRQLAQDADDRTRQQTAMQQAQFIQAMAQQKATAEEEQAARTDEFKNVLIQQQSAASADKDRLSNLILEQQARHAQESSELRSLVVGMQAQQTTLSNQLRETEDRLRASSSRA